MPSPGSFVESAEIVSLRAEHPSRTVPGAEASFVVLAGLGRSGDNLGVAPTQDRIDPRSRALGGELPRAEYDFNTYSSGPVQALVSLLPTYALDQQHRIRYQHAIDDQPRVTVDVDRFRNLSHDVLSNSLETQTPLPALPAGRHTLKLWPLDQGVWRCANATDLGIEEARRYRRCIEAYGKTLDAGEHGARSRWHSDRWRGSSPARSDEDVVSCTTPQWQ